MDLIKAWPLIGYSKKCLKVTQISKDFGTLENSPVLFWRGNLHILPSNVAKWIRCRQRTTNIFVTVIPSRPFLFC